MMKTPLLAIAAAGVMLATAYAATVEHPAPTEALAMALGDMTGVAYVTLRRDGMHLSATLTGNGPAVHFEGVLSDGEVARISLPASQTGETRILAFARTGDGLFVKETSTMTE